MSEQIEETGVEQKEEGTEESPGQELNPEEADPEEEEYEDSDAISVEEEEESDKTVVKDIFDLKTFEPVLKEGEESYDDFSDQDREEYAELFFTDEQVEEIFQQND